MESHERCIPADRAALSALGDHIIFISFAVSAYDVNGSLLERLKVSL